MWSEYKTIIVALLLTVILGAALLVGTSQYYIIEKEACLNTMSDFAVQLASEINKDFQKENNLLHSMAALFGNYENLKTNEVAAIVSSYNKTMLISNIEILFPDNTLLCWDGSRVEAGECLSFEELSVKEELEWRISECLTGEEKILHATLPITYKGQTTAVLCGLIHLDRMENLYKIDAFSGYSEIYIVDADTGEFILDTWHAELVNVEALDNRNIKEGYSEAKIYDDFEKGISGNAIYLSKGAGEDFFCHYEPTGINGWMVVFTVPESIVFARADQVTQTSYLLAGFEVIIFILYLIWMLIYVHKEKYKKENELGRVQYMFNVEKQLFSAHANPEQIEHALREIAEKSTAEKAFFYILDRQKITNNFRWEQERNDIQKWKDEEAESFFQPLHAVLLKSKKILSYDMKRLTEEYPVLKNVLEEYRVKNIMAIVIEEIERGCTAVLGICNMKQHWKDTMNLNCILLSFSMTANNLQVYNTIRQMGMMDSLTGLLNRNSYHAMIAKIGQMQPDTLACVYMDANGLHEVNNHLGHEAGDKMLQAIGNELQLLYGGNNTYRIGGDEFVVLCLNESREFVYGQAERFESAVNKKGYYVSIGIEWRNSNFDIDKIIKTAEDKMQKNKHVYYEEKGDLHKIREMNKQLENILLEKQDADAFLSIISSSFMGVYFVSLDKDTVRHIYIPPYFDEMLKLVDGKFYAAISMYAEKQIDSDFSEAFKRFCEYEQIEEQLLQEAIPEIIYRKKDKIWVRLRIFKFKEYGNGQKETLWIFESMENGA